MEPKSLMWTLVPPKIMPSPILVGGNTGLKVRQLFNTLVRSNVAVFVTLIHSNNNHNYSPEKEQQELPQE